MNVVDGVGDSNNLSHWQQMHCFVLTSNRNVIVYFWRWSEICDSSQC